MKKQRQPTEIIKDILEIVRSRRKIKKTRLSVASNISRNVSKSYFQGVIDSGLIKKDGNQYLSITEKGLEFLKEYKSFETFLEKYGLKELVVAE